MSCFYHDETIKNIFHQNVEKVLVLKETKKTCASIDIKKTYTNSLYNNTEPWCTFDFLSQIEQCDELDGPGKYYIELDDERASDEQILIMKSFFQNQGVVL